MPCGRATALATIQDPGRESPPPAAREKGWEAALSEKELKVLDKRKNRNHDSLIRTGKQRVGDSVSSLVFSLSAGINRQVVLNESFKR